MAEVPFGREAGNTLGRAMSPWCRASWDRKGGEKAARPARKGDDLDAWEYE